MVTGMAIRWINVKAKPMGARPFGARWSVAPRMITTNIAVITNSHTNPAANE